MSERKYSVAEIDRMRAAISATFPCSWVFKGDGSPGRREPDYSAQIEDRLRTYMLAGVDPDELAPPDPPQENAGE